MLIHDPHPDKDGYSKPHILILSTLLKGAYSKSVYTYKVFIEKAPHSNTI
jgi:hypothetical protein